MCTSVMGGALCYQSERIFSAAVRREEDGFKLVYPGHHQTRQQNLMTSSSTSGFLLEVYARENQL